MDGALTFTHVCVDSSQTVLEHHKPFQTDRHPSIHICVDNSQTANCTRALQVLHPIYLPIPKLILKESGGILNHQAQNTNTSKHMLVQGLA